MAELVTKPRDPVLEQWYRVTEFHAVDKGCEGRIYVAALRGRRLKLKLFRHRNEYCRHLVGSHMLSQVLQRHGWTRYVRVPPVLGADPARLGLLTAYISADGSQTETRVNLRAGALAAMTCAAGRVAAIETRGPQDLTPRLTALGATVENWNGLLGVDLSDGNLIFDGGVWWAVDF